MIKVINYTKKPITTMGKSASLCYDSISVNELANGEKEGYAKRIALSCLRSGHDRVAEFADVTVIIDGYSARVMRELYTHIIGSSRLQGSTRYIKYSDGKFGYFVPSKIANNSVALEEYCRTMEEIARVYNTLLELGIPQEDAANILPLGHNSTMTLKMNVRALMHLFHMRTCTRAYHEFRDLMKVLKDVLMALDDEWKELCDSFFKVKCEVIGYCTEHECCGKAYTKKQVLELIQNQLVIDKLGENNEG